MFENVTIGRNCRIRRAIIEDYVEIPAGCEVGQSLEVDRRAGHCVTDSGIVVLHAGSPGVRRREGTSLAALEKRPATPETRVPVRLDPTRVVTVASR